MRSAGLSVFLWILMASFPAADDDALRSLNSWEMAKQLVGSPWLQVELEVSPDQLTKLKEMHEDPKLESLLRDKMRELNSERIAKKVARNSTIEDRRSSAEDDTWPRALWALEDVVAQRLREILEEEQIRRLRPAILRDRFRYAYFALQSTEIMNHCQLSPNDVLDICAKEKELVAEAASKLNEEAATRIFTRCDAESRQKVVEYLGNGPFPELAESYDVAVAGIPFPSFCKSISTWLCLTRMPEWKVDLGLEMSSEQLTAVGEVTEEFSDLVREFGERRKPKETWVQYSKRIQDASTAKVERVLTRKQTLKIYRSRAWTEFFMDFRVPLARRELQEFLGLDGVKLNAVRQAAEQEYWKVREMEREVNRESFARILQSLGAEKSKRLAAVFSGVWLD